MQPPACKALIHIHDCMPSLRLEEDLHETADESTARPVRERTRERGTNEGAHEPLRNPRSTTHKRTNLSRRDHICIQTCAFGEGHVVATWAAAGLMAATALQPAMALDRHQLCANSQPCSTSICARGCRYAVKVTDGRKPVPAASRIYVSNKAARNAPVHALRARLWDAA